MCYSCNVLSSSLEDESPELVSPKGATSKVVRLGDMQLQVPPLLPEDDQPQTAHHIVKHCYHDHSDDLESGESDKPTARGGVVTPFPMKLYEMLQDLDEKGRSDIVSWQPHGRCFVVHKKAEFVQEILPAFFKQSKFPSFLRQLNLYGFQRLTAGRDKGGYYHELFLRGKPFLANKIRRMRVKGTGVRARSSPNSEPNFYAMIPIDHECKHGEARSPQEEQPQEQQKINTIMPERPISSSQPRTCPHLKELMSEPMLEPVPCEEMCAEPLSQLPSEALEIFVRAFVNTTISKKNTKSVLPPVHSDQYLLQSWQC